MTKLISSIEYILNFFFKWRMRILSAVFFLSFLAGKFFYLKKPLMWIKPTNHEITTFQSPILALESSLRLKIFISALHPFCTSE